ncbi:mycofactocin-coupled SDR family oxidoreductase [Pseudonocardia parietis]|uniref:SDR family mycofactocin-dependent oxidoreductase n=1 Tax=Pseudonocardia parietis TaxID=570936 RepID=A0ABS4VYY9_9PSEU|nr:mycofactocin-coupled SDR family oxidoreductase [Pseudonocardia parietis]MBP2369166.1 SDR family mycofactocin-dependent oxidoreductase [Pseudonocardia parietis]
MPGRLEGKVAFITGAARGQGRSHAVRLAAEGADIIGVDICRDIESVPYALATPEDLEETRRLVEEHGRKIVVAHADVRERSQLREAIDTGLAALGRLDVVVANAGILPVHPGGRVAEDFVDAVDVDLLGVMNTVAVALPHLQEFASIVITGSTAAMMPATTSSSSMGPGGAGYGWAKRTLITYCEQMATHLAQRFIRVNTVHPTNCDTPLLHNKINYAAFRPDLENPTREDVLPAFTRFQAMPVPYVDPVDISNAVLFLASEEARYVTGQQLRVDAGCVLQIPGGSRG